MSNQAVSNKNCDKFLYYKNSKEEFNGGASLQIKKSNIDGKNKDLVSCIKISDITKNLKK